MSAAVRASDGHGLVGPDLDGRGLVGPVRRPGLARWCHGVLAVLCLTACLVSFYIGATRPSELLPGAGFSTTFPQGWRHMANQPFFFTWMSNALVGVTSLLLVINPGRRSTAFQVVRLSGLICLIITGVVFNVLLRSNAEMTLLETAQDAVQHITTPILAPLLWVLFGPRGQVTWRRIGLSMIIPIAWLLVTLVRGSLIDWYPYIILDVPGQGWARVMALVGAILVFYLLVGAALWWLDRLLGRGSGLRSDHLEQLTD